MSFSNLFFPFVFLPISVGLYFIFPKKLKNPLLVLLSLFFFAWGRPVYVLLLILCILFNHFTGRELAALSEGNRRKLVLWTGVGANLLLLGFFKYWGFLVSSLGSLFGADWTVSLPPSPAGISFFTFSALAYLYDVYRNRAEGPGSLLDCALYISFFPKLISGPIISWKEMQPQLHDHPMTKELVLTGGRRFVTGLAKKLLIANTLGNTFYAISAGPVSELSVLTAWIGAVSYSLMLYFDFSSYSDMAIGLGQIFGFRLPENFLYPYTSGSMTDFWRTWHASLGAWFRDYVYIPLGGSRAGKGKTIRNLIVVWALTGLWHGANWTFVFWGLYHVALLLLEKFVLKSLAEKMPKALRHVLTVLLAVIGWVFFFSPSIGSAFGWLFRMFSPFSVPFIGAAGRYYLRGSWLILLVSILGATPLPRTLGMNLLRERSPVTRILAVVFFALLLYFCTAGMLSDTYSSFLYFQF